VATAGAAVCKLAGVVSLGSTQGNPVAGFGKDGGLAAWKQDADTLLVQRLAPGGAVLGGPAQVRLTAEQEPKAVYALDRGFVVLLLRWDWQHGDSRWWGVVVNRDGHAERSPVEIGLGGMDVAAGQVADAEHVVLLVWPAAIAPNRAQLRGRWQTLHVDASGVLTSAATAVAIDDLVTTTQDHFEPARLAGSAGWVVLRNGVLRPAGVFGGRRQPAAEAVLLRGSDGISAEVVDRAVPPPPGPRGRIYEAQRRPALARAHDGQPLGQPLDLEVDGFPVGVHGVVIQTDLVWSGTHFLYPFRSSGTKDVASLLPIDCHP
jgi:hypothetical protein